MYVCMYLQATWPIYKLDNNYIFKYYIYSSKGTHSSNKGTDRKTSRKVLPVCYNLWILCFKIILDFKVQGLKSKGTHF